MPHDKGIKVRSPRAGERRAVTARLRTVAATLRNNVSIWACSADVWDQEQLNKTGYPFRYRTVEEYPENDASQLDYLIDSLESMIVRLHHVLDWARHRRAQLPR